MYFPSSNGSNIHNAHTDTSNSSPAGRWNRASSPSARCRLHGLLFPNVVQKTIRRKDQQVPQPHLLVFRTIFVTEERPWTSTERGGGTAVMPLIALSVTSTGGIHEPCESRESSVSISFAQQSSPQSSQKNICLGRR